MSSVNQFLSKCLLVGALVASSFSATAATDPVVLTFSTVGDSRQDPQNIDSTSVIASKVGVGSCPISSGTGLTSNPGLSGQDCKWLQNTKAWSRIMRSIQAQKPSMLFFNGDMVMGYGKAGAPVTRTSNGNSETAIASPAVSDIVNSDLMQFYQQYGFWRGMVTNLQETGTYIVPVPGNHETQCKRCSKKAQVENENAWRDNMGDLIIDKNRFPFSTTSLNFSGDTASYPGAADGINTSQDKLSYSFDVADSHFVVINTDPVGKDGFAPTAWLGTDFSAAKARGAKHFFVFGHKPAAPYIYAAGVAPSGLDSTSAPVFWALIEQYKATYFCGHEHIYNMSQPTFTTTSGTVGGSAYQVIVGGGGSPFDAASTATTYNPLTDRSYSWATVQIHQSGLVDIKAYGFDANFGPTQSYSSVTLPQ